MQVKAYRTNERRSLENDLVASVDDPRSLIDRSDKIREPHSGQMLPTTGAKSFSQGQGQVELNYYKRARAVRARLRRRISTKPDPHPSVLSLSSSLTYSPIHLLSHHFTTDTRDFLSFTMGFTDFVSETGLHG